MPTISIITAVRNGLPLIERAYGSIARQAFADWEWLTVDDGSTDGTGELLGSLAARDPRVRLLLHHENQGAAAARNTALRAARGEFIAYLDHDDEYYPDYLAQVAQMRDKGDVLVFGYDMIFDDGEAQGRKTIWDPGRVRDDFFASCIVTPLGVAHRCALVERVGGFNELLWRNEDWDFWKRLARAGARFTFVQAKSGLFHVRSGSLSRTGKPNGRQRGTIEGNWRSGRPIFADGDCKSEISDLRFEIGKEEEGPHPGPLPVPERTSSHRPLLTAHRSPPTAHLAHPKREKTRKIAFVSPHCVLDFTNGAATATLDGLSLLAQSGFECQAFCNSRIDAWEEVLMEEILAQRQVRYIVRNAQIGPHRGRMIFTTHNQVAVTLFNSASTRGGWINNEEIAAFLAACEIFLKKNRPDVVWTYGGDPVSLAVQKLAKRLDIPILFALHNFAYRDASAFEMVDYVIVPTDFCRQFYWNTIGLASLYLPLVVDPERVQLERGQSPHPEGEGTTAHRPPPTAHSIPPTAHCPPTEQYVTFVNPEPRKGIHFFARIVEVLFRKRPDIPLLMVEGASKASFLPQLGIDLSGAKNLRIMPNAPDARGFHAMTKILIMPSFMENAGLVAMEAMLNGIPVLASNRGGLRETVGDGGFLFDIPARYTPETRGIPTAEEVGPWVETIIRLWDDAVECERWSQAARKRAERWRPQFVAPVYCEFFGNLTHQPGPPLMPHP